MRYKFTVAFVSLFALQLLYAQNKPDKAKQQQLIEEYLNDCANTINYNMPEWQECLDTMLAKDSTVAYFWQQKAMPYFKQRKYEVGMKYLDKAVLYDKEQLPYRAFIKCIFSKNYKEAIADFEAAKKLFGNGYEMDHTFNFYIAISYLQLNEFKKAETILAAEIAEQAKKGEDFVHYLDRFYYGISLYEQKRWNDAIAQFDKAIKEYPQFSDAKYYKYVCLHRIEKTEEAKKLFGEMTTDYNNGYTINEDNTAYELYPYQIKIYK